jgi:hypothetical protein
MIACSAVAGRRLHCCAFNTQKKPIRLLMGFWVCQRLRHSVLDLVATLLQRATRLVSGPSPVNCWGWSGTPSGPMVRLMDCRRFASVGFHRGDELVLNLILDGFEPLLGTSGPSLEALCFCLKLRNSILGSTQL